MNEVNRRLENLERLAAMPAPTGANFDFSAMTDDELLELEKLIERQDVLKPAESARLQSLLGKIRELP
jgi:hypothetical protein